MFIEENYEIKKQTSFKIGGNISKVYFPESVEDFSNNEIPENAFIFGNLSNTLISTYGSDIPVVSTSKLNNIKVEGTKIIADAGVKGPKLSQVAQENGLSGLEFMIGFPGSVGGEVTMNASANGQCISDTLVSVICYSKEKGIIKFSKDEMGFDYRTSRCQNEKLIVLQAEFELEQKDKAEIQAKMNDNLAFRKSHQPSLALPNCGSVFKNPQGDSAGRLLDSCDVKNLKVGGVRVWENHANFIVNDNNGTSLDVLNLMLEMKQRVQKKYNINLTPEVYYFGGKNKDEEILCNKLYQK